ncbi:MAG: uroporphyrinogen decarboxylase [Puniceicoccaceae bacterium]|nr:MAG: uroporphyrinogen decarboxylase [Puniceicoccaceae bacterium]
MTPWERYRATLDGRPVDHLPRIPILMQFAAEFIGSNYGAFAADHRVLVEANLRCAEAFGFDQLSAISDPYRETAGFGGTIEFVANGVPRCHGPLEDDEAIAPDRLTAPDPRTAPRMRDRLDAIRLMRSRCGNHYSVLGWVEGPGAEAADLRGVATFLMDLVDDPEGAGALMDVTLKTAIDFALAQVEAGADTIGIGEAIGSQVSADHYRSLFLPRMRRLVDAIREAGAFVKLHICGNITHLLDDLATLPIHSLDLDHFVDPATARSRIGKSMVLATNLDPVAVIRRGTPAEIRSRLESCYAALGNPCMVNAGCEIPSGTPEENLRALCAPLSWSAFPDS